MAKVSYLVGTTVSPDAEARAVKRIVAVFNELKLTENLSQAVLAKRMGLKQQSAISQYFRGACALNMIAVVNFAQALNVSPSDIYPELMEPVRASFLKKIEIEVRYAIVGTPIIKTVQYAKIQDDLEEYGVHLNVSDYMPYKQINSFVICSNLVKINQYDEVFITLSDETRFLARFMSDKDGVTKVLKLEDNKMHDIPNNTLIVCDAVIATQRAANTLELKN